MMKRTLKNKTIVGLIITLLVIIFSIIMLESCNDSTLPTDAVKMTVSQVSATPGFEWFAPRLAEYIPDTNIISQIKTVFDTSKYKFYIYCKPSCSCEESQKVFPRIMKVLMEAGVPESRYEIFSMAKPTYFHPYKNKFFVNSIPATFTSNTNDSFYSIVDTIDAIKVRYPDSVYTVEKIILYSLK